MIENPMPTSPQQLFEVFKDLDIQYKNYDHAPVFTVEESQSITSEIPGTHCRNLFLRDKKKKMFLVVAANETPVDLKKLENKLNCARLSFGSPERLWQYLGVRPGSVCPFAVINDTQREVEVILDADMMDSGLVCYHPLLNAMSVTLTPADLLKFFAHTGHTPRTLAL